MCNKVIQFGEEVEQGEDTQAEFLMDSPSASGSPDVRSATVSTPGSNDENRRVKFLCSFSGSIIPRPQDGKLRYVGGETRIVSVPRDIKYDDLMRRMKELFEDANLLKYQQPDEDLDALVSIVNDDDVTNMMEEYDKLGSGDGFIRLRIFLFSHPDQDVPLHFIEPDERNSERRYVDALNNMNDPPEFWNQQWSESPRMSFIDDVYAGEQYYINGPEGSVHNQRNWDMSMLPYNMQQAQYGSGQVQQISGHRYNDMEPPWIPTPAYYSPRHHGHFDPRPSEFPHSPSSARFRMPVEFSDGRFSEDYQRLPKVIQQPPPVIHHPQQVYPPTMIEHRPQLPDNATWVATDTPPSDKFGFPGNVLQGIHKAEGSSIYGQCHATVKRNPPDVDHSQMGNGQQQPLDSWNQCHPTTDSVWMPNNQLNPRAEGVGRAIPGTGRLSDHHHYIVDGSGFTTPVGNYTLQDGPQVSSNYSQFEEPRYIRPGYEFVGETFTNKVASPGSHIQNHGHEVPYGNSPLVYGTENSYQSQYGHAPGHGSMRNDQTPLAPGYELPTNLVPNNALSSGYPRNTREGSPTMHIAVENQSILVQASPEVGGLDASAMLEYPHGHTLRLNTRNSKHRPVNLATDQNMRDSVGNHVGPVELLIQASAPASVPVDEHVVVTNFGSIKETGDATEVVEGNGSGEAKGTLPTEVTGGIKQIGIEEEKQAGMTAVEAFDTHVAELSTENGECKKVDEKDPPVLRESNLSVEQLSFLPELIASVKKAALDGAEEVKAKFQDHSNSAVLNGSPDKEINQDNHVDGDSDSDIVDTSKIEPTKAEAEAIARGLQTIKNDDLEEIRELGSGTYGAVYHGKWKGSDVAVKRIKASCFAGKPSERERLIEDFWKEALLLSSLHHPNIVTFYGIVRDGPDGSLATVTEFMTNGSLKQFLQKKDRKIDRRKRLIIAMDAAFGMEYLHGKNIVHFDLKCENLLVNMKDPQRPVCKIGDLGLSKVKQHTLVSGGVRGTLPWMAPELLSGKSNMVSENVDVYSFGIVMWELLTGEEPYKEMHCASIIGGIVNNTLRPQIPTWCDPEWKSLMESCWAANPVDRPSFTEISQKLRSMAAAMKMK